MLARQQSLLHKFGIDRQHSKQAQHEEIDGSDDVVRLASVLRHMRYSVSTRSERGEEFSLTSAARIHAKVFRARQGVRALIESRRGSNGAS